MKIDAHAVLFTVRISGAFPYETRPVNGTALILVTAIHACVRKWVV